MRMRVEAKKEKVSPCLEICKKEEYDALGKVKRRFLCSLTSTRTQLWCLLCCLYTYQYIFWKKRIYVADEVIITPTTNAVDGRCGTTRVVHFAYRGMVDAGYATTTTNKDYRHLCFSQQPRRNCRLCATQQKSSLFDRFVAECRHHGRYRLRRQEDSQLFHYCAH